MTLSDLARFPRQQLLRESTLQRLGGHQDPAAHGDRPLSVHQRRVSQPHEEGDQITHGDRCSEHPGRAEVAGEAGRPPGQDSKGPWRVSGAGAVLLPPRG